MNLETLIKSLEQAENDNKRFALLLILSELIKSKKLDSEVLKNDPYLNKRLFGAIGAHFLARLITTKQQNAETNNSPLLLKSVGLSILTQFLDFPDLITDPILLTKLDVIIDLLINLKKEEENGDEQQESKNEICQMIRVDIFKYLYSLSVHCPDYLILNVDLIDSLFKDVILNCRYSTGSTFKAMLDFESCFKTNDTDFALISCQLIKNLCKENQKEKQVKSNKSYSKIKSEKIGQMLFYFVERVNKDQTEFKFFLLNYLNYFMQQEEVFGRFFNDDESKFADLIFNILNDLLKSKLNQEAKDLAFVLLNNFVKLYQFEYVYMKNRPFFYLTINLLCIQVGLNLENISLSKDLYLIANKMSIYYSLLEEVIIILSTADPFGNENDSISSTDDRYYDSDASENDQDNDIDFKTTDKKEAISEPELSQAIKVIVECLQSIIGFIRDSLDLESKDFKNLNSNMIMLLVSSIRVILCWLSYESLLEDEIVDLIRNRVVKFADYLNDELHYDVNVLEFVLPGVQRVKADQENRLIQKIEKSKSKQDEVKLEFQKIELKENIESLNKILEKCTVNK
jgi:hypothetical protein